MNAEMMTALKAVAVEKGVEPEVLLEALANALVTAYKKMPESAEEAMVEVDIETGAIKVIAQDIDENGIVIKEWDDTPSDFGRIAAQTAKYVISQRIKEVEGEQKFNEYAGREGDIVTGIVQQSDQRYTLIDLGKAEALLPQSEQVYSEKNEHGSRVKAYLLEVKMSPRGPQIVVSRNHPAFVAKLFELEVPEIADGVVQIDAIAREPGSRSKVAVSSNDSNVDAVGSCVGARGARVRNIVTELNGEKVDIIRYSEDPVAFISDAIAQAKVQYVVIHEDEKMAEVVVPDEEHPLAIGHGGVNARLTARLTGWRINIRSLSEYLGAQEAAEKGAETKDADSKSTKDAPETKAEASEDDTVVENAPEETSVKDVVKEEESAVETEESVEVKEEES
jgi:N utilization substance protein A